MLLNQLWDNPSWDEELTHFIYKPQPELPEDVLYILLNKNPKLSELIERFDLELEY